jgi:hypothetical protein
MQFFPKGSEVLLRARSIAGKRIFIPVIVIYPGTDREFAEVILNENSSPIRVCPTRLQPR